MPQYILTAAIALITLALFDSNPWWKVLIYAIFAAALNMGINLVLPVKLRIATAAIQGFAGALLAHLAGLTPFFRTTFGTLVGFALLLALGELLLFKFYVQKT